MKATVYGWAGATKISPRSSNYSCHRQVVRRSSILVKLSLHVGVAPTCTLMYTVISTTLVQELALQKIAFFTPVGHGVFYCFASRTSSGSSLWLRLRSPLFLLLGLRCLLSRPFLMTCFFSKQVLVQLVLLRCRKGTTVYKKSGAPLANRSFTDW